ncbi:ubiquitin-protein transferase activating protein [Conglomerata obtusa]
MKKLSLSSIFNTELRSTRVVQDRYVTLGINNKIMSSSKLVTTLRSNRIENRLISHSPYKILDAPGVADDFYLNILDWSVTNQINIGLSDSLYQYNVNTKSVNEILKLNGNIICGVRSKGNYIAVGSNDGMLYVMDGMHEILKYKTNDARVCSIDWNDTVVSVGTQTGSILHYDTRIKNVIAENNFHESEICGLKWSTDKKYLASGSNDNTIKIWQIGTNIPKNNITAHKSAVKAISWCPWKTGVLTTGGGTKDKSIKTWNVNDNELITSTNVDSQVCGLIYIEKYKEIISSHGYSENCISLWKANGMKKMDTFGNHDSRVLNIAANENGNSLVSIGSDENLKFWNIYEEKKMINERTNNSFR